ncbi:MAG: DNA polymerase III subunit gamma/tau [Sumerlaeia bacterium]
MADSSYQVIARRYRPQVFADLIGQKSVVSQLQNEIRENRNGHGYLFCGPRGTGKTSTARIFAKALNCEKGPTVEPCGKCSHCLEIANGTHLDIIEVDAATYTKADDTKALLEGLHRAPFSARDKIYIIDEVHMLSNHSFNALLKSLEEPPAHVVFILATTNPEKIPETVLSRCRRLNFDRIDPNNIVQSLDAILQKEKVDVATGEREPILKAIALASEGGLRDAQVLLDQLISLSSEELTLEITRSLLGVVETDLFHQLLTGLAQRDVGVCLELVNNMVDRGRDLQRFIKMFLSFLRDAMLYKAGASADLIRILDPKDPDIQSTLKSLSLPYLLNIVQQFMELESSIRGAVPPRFLLEFTLIKLTAIDPRLLVDASLSSNGSSSGNAPKAQQTQADASSASSATSALGQAKAYHSIAASSAGGVTPPQTSANGGFQGIAKEYSTAGNQSLTTAKRSSVAAAPLMYDAQPLEVDDFTGNGQSVREDSPSGSTATLEVIHTTDADRWGAFVEQVGAQLLSVKSVLEHARCESIDQNSLVIALHPRDRIMRTQLDKPEIVLVLRKEARMLWGRPLMISFTEQTNDSPVGIDPSASTPAQLDKNVHFIEVGRGEEIADDSGFSIHAEIHDMDDVIVESGSFKSPFGEPLTLDQALEQFPDFKKACDLFKQHLGADPSALNGKPLNLGKTATKR